MGISSSASDTHNAELTGRPVDRGRASVDSAREIEFYVRGPLERSSDGRRPAKSQLMLETHGDKLKR